MTTPHPGSRLDATQRAATAAAPADPEHVAAPEPVMTAVPVTLQGQAPALHGRYATITVPASSGAQVGYRQVLAYDELRQSALLVALDGPVIVCNTLEQAQDPANIGQTFPSASFATAGLPVAHREAVWVANPSTTASVRVSVAQETGRGE